MAAGLFTACSGDNDDLTPAGNDERVPLEILASIKTQAEGITRASETAWEADDDIGVTVTSRGSSTIFPDGDKTKGENLPYTFNDGTNYDTYGTFYRLFTPKSTKVYLTSTFVDVYGYYPYKSTLPEHDPMTVIPINVSNQTSQKAIDFMRAKKGNVSNANTAIELLFYHRLVKLIFNLKQGEGLLTDELKDAPYLSMSIKDQPTEATYNIFEDKCNNMGTFQDITLVQAASAPTGYVRTFEAIVLPNGNSNPASDRTVSVTFYRNSEDKIVNTFKIPISTYFESGYKYIYNVTVNATSLQVDPLKYTEQW